ncbi:MAG TPA: hypothetical protein VG103_10870 [Chthoniobacterales bacterium]|jgi:hypothetical protein|nr:hypothetical protein [Chthoniobacterales bacterium]
MKFTTLSAYLIACSLSFVLSHGAIGKEKDEDTDESESEVTIEKTVLARKTEDGFDPVKSFKPDDTFAVLVLLSEPKIGTKLKAVWTIVDAGDMQDKKLLEKKIELTAEAIEGVKEANRINFSLSHDDPYPAGDYKVDIYLNGELAKTVEFRIK